jgi:DNA polymerase I
LVLLLSRTTAVTIYRDWRELPFREIWCVDTEFYPGAGKNNGGKEGDLLTPLCLVGYELRSRRLIRLWQDELRNSRFPAYRLDNDALIASYGLAAEFGTHLALGWGEPACALDLHVEFRHFCNDGSIENGKREKGFYGLAGALRFFCEGDLDVVRKELMRDRILDGPPFTAQERSNILTYCTDDTRGAARVLAHLLPTIRSLPHAMLRSKFQWAMAKTERRGVPLDMPWLTRIRRQWGNIRTDLVRELDRFGLYEIVGGVAHWRKGRWAAFIERNGLSWTRTEAGAYSEEDEVFREMEGLYPFVGPLRELRYSLSKLKLSNLRVGSDGRNRCPAWAYGTKTARNAPSATGYVFGPAKWIRMNVAPPPGRALIHRDYCQQEVRIAGLLSGDAELLAACESGDVYLGVAGQLGFLSSSMSAEEVEGVRALFKTVTLGIAYGLGPKSLAVRAGISLYEAVEILSRLCARFRVYDDFGQRTLDRAGLDLELSTPFDWVMQCPSGINPRTVRNFPMQSTAAEVLHAVCIMAERRSIPIVATVHDAVMVEVPIEDVEEASAALDRVMRDASAVVLQGYELPTDVQIIRPGERFHDKRGIAMWDTVTRLVASSNRHRRCHEPKASYRLPNRMVCLGARSHQEQGAIRPGALPVPARLYRARCDGDGTGPGACRAWFWAMVKISPAVEPGRRRHYPHRAAKWEGGTHHLIALALIGPRVQIRLAPGR